MEWMESFVTKDTMKVVKNKVLNGADKLTKIIASPETKVVVGSLIAVASLYQLVATFVKTKKDNNEK